MQQNSANRLAFVAGLLLVGALIGFYVRPLLHSELQVNSESARSPSLPPGLTAEATQMVAACNFDPDQLDRLAGRMAPLLVQQLKSLDSKSGTNAVDANQQRENREQEKASQTAAFSNATQIVDQMIASHHVTHEGMADAIKLLQQSDQTDRAYELQGRVAAAVNRRELTLEEAGLMLPGHVSNQMH